MFVWKAHAACHAQLPKKRGINASPSKPHDHLHLQSWLGCRLPSDGGVCDWWIRRPFDGGGARPSGEYVAKREKSRGAPSETSGEGGKEGAQGIRKELPGTSGAPLQAPANQPREKPDCARRSEDQNRATKQKPPEGQCAQAHAKGTTKSQAASGRKNGALVAPNLGASQLEKALKRWGFEDQNSHRPHSSPWFATSLHILAF